MRTSQEERVVTTSQRTRKPKKPKVESLYKVLGVRSNATPESIKKSYIRMVKEHPPEQDPEQFQIIRSAYDTLRDPAKRKAYDFQRKYGGSIEHLLQEAFEWMNKENWDKAEKLYREAIRLAPEAVGAYLGLLQIALVNEKTEEAERQTEALLELFPSGEERMNAYGTLTNLWFEHGYSETALQYLNRLRQEFPDQDMMTYPLLASIYQDLGRAEEAYLMIEERMIAADLLPPDQYDQYFIWINGMIHLGKWQYWSRVQPKVKKFLLSVEDEEDRLVIASAIKDEYYQFKQQHKFKEAELYADLALMLDRTDEEFKSLKKEIQYVQRLQKEIDLLPKDLNLPPVVGIQVHTFFLADVMGSNADTILPGYDQLIEQFGKDMTGQELKRGIERIKSRYKLLYARYRDQIEELASV